MVHYPGAGSIFAADDPGNDKRDRNCNGRDF
jgi:hypothetical protein